MLKNNEQTSYVTFMSTLKYLNTSWYKHRFHPEHDSRDEWFGCSSSSSALRSGGVSKVEKDYLNPSHALSETIPLLILLMPASLTLARAVHLTAAVESLESDRLA